MSESHIFSDPALARGVELTPVQIWRDPATQNIIIEVEAGKTQAVFTPAQWRRAIDFLDIPPAEESE